MIIVSALSQRKREHRERESLTIDLNNSKCDNNAKSIQIAFVATLTDCFDLGKTPRATQVPFSDEDQECEGPNQTTCAWTWKRL